MDKKEYFTYQEIISQPETWHETLSHLEDLPLNGFPGLAAYDRVIFSGCGSTYYLAIWAAHSAQATVGVESRALPASEIMLAPQDYLGGDAKTLLVAISRSGATTETLHAVRTFKDKTDGDVAAITCYPSSELSSLCDFCLAVPAGQEESVAQTRSFTNMMLAIARLISGAPPAGLPVTMRASAGNLIADFAHIAKDLGADPHLQRFFFLGSQELYGLASEAMLKMKEMSLSYSEVYHFMEFRHGPMSMVNGESLVVGLLSSHGYPEELALLRDMKALGAKLLVVSPQHVAPQLAAEDTLVTFESSNTLVWQDALYLPVLQLLSFQRSVTKHLNPDRPEHLSSVVVLN